MSNKRKIYLIAHGWHTGFLIPSSEICSGLPQLKQRFPDAAYLEFGWGDQHYFQTPGSAFSAKLRAVLIPSGSTMHVAGFPDPPENYSDAEPMLPLLLSSTDYQSLVNFIMAGFEKNQGGDITEQIPGLYGDSQFYKGAGIYYLFNTCNKWTAEGLRAASIDIQPRFKLSAKSVLKVVNNRSYGNV